ncbi:unnamed protein product [Linum trigynum]|uniref:Uncharacterized protein n=1 Tax=Linum trigynum TaxID=586398 RepID=A0AAV2DSI7_9ROSI
MTRLRKIKWSAMHASTSLVWWVDFCSPTSGFLFPDKSNWWIQGIWLPLLTGVGRKRGKELGIGRVSWPIPGAVHLLEGGSKTSWFCDVYPTAVGMGASSNIRTSRPTSIPESR